MKKKWFPLLIAIAIVLGSLVFVQVRDGRLAGQEAETPEQPAPDPSRPQPIAFPHNIHAGINQIDCQYCHFSAERSPNAGIPPVQTCMGCHASVQGTANPEEVAMLRGYAQRMEAIPWNRIYKLPDHVQFPHMRHISGGVECAACHGNVEEIGVMQEVAQPLTMGWCLTCHMEMGAARDCTVCHY